MLAAEKKTLYRFVGIYILSTMLFIVLALTIYYHHEMSSIENRQKEIMDIWSKEFIAKLQIVHQEMGDEIEYPVDSRFETAIFDNRGGLIYSTFVVPKYQKLGNLFYTKDDKNIFITTVSPHFLGAAYLIIETPLDLSGIYSLQKQILYFFLTSLLVVFFIAYWMGKLFIKPLRDAYAILDNFIKDATHELNTPIHTILTNIELLEDIVKPKELQVSLDRIEIASKTLNGIYKDLVFLKLDNSMTAIKRAIKVDEIVKERIDYFALSLRSKKLKLTHNIASDIECNIDRYHFSRLFDNLLSNAIKYNVKNGNISIVCAGGYLSVENNSSGISEENIKNATKRFQRFDLSEGGFGIGLNVVYKIAKMYNLILTISSVKDATTKVEIRW